MKPPPLPSSLDAALEAPTPCVGHMVALRTKAEVRATFDLTQVYVVQVPLQAANSLLRRIDETIHRLEGVNLQHLRRFVKPASLPLRLRQEFEFATSKGPSQTMDGCPEEKLQISRVLPENESGNDVVPDASTLYLLVCSATAVSLERVVLVLSSDVTFQTNNTKPRVHVIPVPAQAPASEEQAKQWSQDYWPAVYKKHNPHGPAPSVLSRAEDGLQLCVGTWMAIARTVASDSASLSVGEGIGAVVVDPSMAGGPTAVATAGDARWKGKMEQQVQDSGNVMAHAVMRVIGMVARKRREALPSHVAASPDADLFLDYPLTPGESAVYSRDAIEPGGYLCTGLQIFLTHEPCVMCSMAILHSRFDQVVFAKSMPRTGALSADAPGLAYGLFWLPELNWKMLAWHFVEMIDQRDALPACTARSIHA
ncbi:tRNA-specific adenosine deaminase subunit tad3 [Trapelia coarctata]|nr:tRNA-specific adenosine deaminase subunit tad3 [Trapelia coarctata]